MANQEHIEVVKQGRARICEWKKGNAGVKFDLREANLQGHNLSRADLSQADLSRADLSQTDLSHADLTQANLCEAKLYKTNLRETFLSDANLKGIKDAEHARYLDTVILVQGDVKNFSECNRKKLEKYLDWSRLRTVGRLPLFGASYSALILIPIIFYVFAIYNNSVDTMRDMVDKVLHWLGELTRQDPSIVGSLLYEIRIKAHNLLQRWPIPSQSLLILISTILLAIGSSLYTFFCPPRIKEYSQTQWCDELKCSLLHYWPLAWKYRWVRFLCAFSYALGGLGALWVIGTKVWGTAKFIIHNSTLPLSFF